VGRNSHGVWVKRKLNEGNGKRSLLKVLRGEVRIHDESSGCCDVKGTYERA